MVELKAEAILLGRPLNQLTGGKDDCPDPVTALGLLAAIEKQKAGLQDAP